MVTIGFILQLIPVESNTAFVTACKIQPNPNPKATAKGQKTRNGIEKTHTTDSEEQAAGKLKIQTSQTQLPIPIKKGQGHRNIQRKN